MNSLAVVVGAVFVLFLFVIAFALCRKDSVCAAVWFRPFGFFLEAKNDKADGKRKI
jgi:NADH:ubiquinone oxidoreductase subunit 6 (subunit J)